jgi:PAS domain S-box-containing protein
MTKTTITKKKPSGELEALRQRIAELEALELKLQAEKNIFQLEGEERYKAAFESANDVIMLMDKNGKIIDVNEKITEIGGYEREEFIGKNIRSLARIMTKKSLAIILGNFLKRMAGADVNTYEVELYKLPRPYGRGFRLFQTSFALNLFYLVPQCIFG